MTNSEKLLSSFSENYFYKELVYADLKFTPIGGTEIELADLIINLEDTILAIQLKERNEKDRTQDKNIEEKFVLNKPQKNENLVQQYLYEKYGENAIYEDRLYYELFRQYVLVLYEHKEIESEINGCYEVIKFLAHLFRDEIKCFVERTEKALLIAKTKKFNLVGTLRNVQKEYAIVFTATEQGEQIPSEKLLPVVFEKQKVHTLLQVITYWVNDNEYMIDFVLWQG